MGDLGQAGTPDSSNFHIATETNILNGCISSPSTEIFVQSPASGGILHLSAWGRPKLNPNNPNRPLRLAYSFHRDRVIQACKGARKAALWPTRKTRDLIGCSLLRRDQIHQTRSWYEDNLSLDVLNMRCPSLVGRYLADQWRRLDPKAIVLNESYDARINIPGIEQPEKYLLISQVGFVNHSGDAGRISSNIIPHERRNAAVMEKLVSEGVEKNAALALSAGTFPAYLKSFRRTARSNRSTSRATQKFSTIRGNCCSTTS